MSDHIITLEKSNGCSAQIHLYGATVTSWVSGGTEQLFLSSTSKMDGTKAIRGGIPLVFPNFGPWENGPQHGFARISWWNVTKAPHTLDNGDIEAELELTDSVATRKMWNFNFVLKYKVILGDTSLSCHMEIKNTGSAAFDFTTLLHTYFRIPDIHQCTVSGFENCTYSDKVKGTSNNTELRVQIKVDGNVDSVYKQAGNTTGHTITTPSRCIKIEKTNLPDTVLWNPWSEKAAAMSDFDSDGYLSMICVEAGYVADRKVLDAGCVFLCSQKLAVV